MEILKKTGKFLLGVVIGVAIMMFADRYYVKGKRLIADNLPKEPVEYVNPYMGNISHLLVPTYPTVHLPNSMLRVYPERGDFTGDRLGGLPLIVTSHRGSSAFNLSPYQGDEAGLNLLSSIVTIGKRLSRIDIRYIWMRRISRSIMLHLTRARFIALSSRKTDRLIWCSIAGMES